MALVPKTAVQAAQDFSRDCANLASSFYKIYPLVPATTGSKFYADHLLNTYATTIPATMTKADASKLLQGKQQTYIQDRKTALINISTDGDPLYSKLSPQNLPSNWLDKNLQIPGGVEDQMNKLIVMLQ